MATANEMRKKTEQGILENIYNLIEHEAEKGRGSVDLSDYDGLYLTESMITELEKDGYEIEGQTISW